jgi:hypothetical protein
MSTEILVAFIALGGVFISVLVSIITSTRTTATEIQKLRTEIQRTYADKLLDERLKVYPDMYYLLSDFRKKVKAGTFSKDDLEKLRTQTNEWNSKYSLLFSGQAVAVSYQFRKGLDEIIRNDISSTININDLRNIAGEFELVLKYDIGIYTVEFADPSKKFTTYPDLIKEATG